MPPFHVAPIKALPGRKGETGRGYAKELRDAFQDLAQPQLSQGYGHSAEIEIQHQAHLRTAERQHNAL